MQGGMWTQSGAARNAMGTTALACALVPALVMPAVAQELPNPLLTFSLSSSLNVSDNYDLSPDSPGTSTFLDNTLGLAYQSETNVQLLRFGIGGVVRLADLPQQGRDASFDNQSLSFEYRRFGVDSELQLRGRYNRADLAFFDPLNLIEIEDPLTGEDLIVTREGYRETLDLGASLQTGLSSPLSFSLSANTRQRNFVGTDDTVDNLFDTVTNSLSASTGALITPATRLSLSGAVSDYSAEDEEETDRLSRSLSLGVSQELARALTLQGSIGYQLIDTDETDPFGQRGTTRTDGVIGSLSAVQQLTNGDIGLSFSRTISTNGARDMVQITRSLDLPDGSLALAAGVSQGESGHNTLIGSVDYVQRLTSGRITLGLSRDVRTDDDDQELEVTRARLGWDHDLTAVSGLGFNVDYASTDAPSGGVDRQRGRLRASYRHSLTQDWNLSSGYEYTVSQRAGQDDATENALFLTIGRQFQFRP